MILDRFRTWAQTASPVTRAEGARSLSRAYLYARSNEKQRHDAAAILTSFLDDPSLLVRTALAETLAGAQGAPHHIIVALADDMPSIAAIVLAASPILSAAELIDCAMTGGATAQAAIAARPNLAASVAATIAEIGDVEAAVSLARNDTATLTEAALRRMTQRFADHDELREALLARRSLPTAIRIEVIASTMRSLAGGVSDRLSDERVKRAGREARHKAVIALADASGGRDGMSELARTLRESGDLTLSLVFRAILSGRIEFFKAALGALADVPVERIDQPMARCDSSAFASLCRKADLPSTIVPAIRIAIVAARETDWSMLRSAGLSSLVIERVLTGCDAINTGELDTLMVLLRRFESEAAREATRPSPRDARHAGALVLRRERLDAAPLVLEDRRRTAPPRREPRVLTIDLAAIEAELCAA